MKQYIVDAFTNKPFSGNPAAVCVMEGWPSDDSMMKLAMENNLSETAFVVKEPQGYRLRWFTPGTEVELCGYEVWAFGEAPDKLASLVKDGIKTATCSAYDFYEAEDESLPVVGEYSVIYQ